MQIVKRMSMLQYAEEGSMMPRGYGVAWYELGGCRAVLLPVPIHVIASSIRTAWHWFRRLHAKDLFRAEYDRGFAEGYRFHVGEGRRAEERTILTIVGVLRDELLQRIEAAHALMAVERANDGQRDA